MASRHPYLKTAALAPAGVTVSHPKWHAVLCWAYLDVHVREGEVVEDEESLVLQTLRGDCDLLVPLRSRQQGVNVGRVRNWLLQTNPQTLQTLINTQLVWEVSVNTEHKLIQVSCYTVEYFTSITLICCLVNAMSY